MKIISLLFKREIKLTMLFLLVFIGDATYCHPIKYYYSRHVYVNKCIIKDTINYEAVLDQKPYFADHRAHATDSLFIRDLDILKHFIKFEGAEEELLKGPVLNEMMYNEVEKSKPETYRTIVDFIIDYRQTVAYKDFIAGVILFRKMENKKINIKNWNQDQALFMRLGFTESDLADFRKYIGQRKYRKLSYKEAYLQYVKELNELGTVNSK